MTPHDEPRRPLGVAVSLEKETERRRGRATGAHLVPPPEHEPPDTAASAPAPEPVSPSPVPHDPSGLDPLTRDPDRALSDPGFLDPPPPPPRFGVVPVEVSLRIPLWWSDGRRADLPLPPNARKAPNAPNAPNAPERPEAEEEQPAFAEPERPFAWAFDGAEEPPAYSSGGRRILWILGGAAALAAVVAAALVLGGERGKTAERPGGPPPSAPQAPAAAPPGPASAYVPRALTLGGFENKVQVTWQPPERIGEVAGFMVVAQTRDGAVLEHRLAPVGETSAVFAAPPMTRDGCIVVAALVRGPTGVTPMRADPVCLTP